MTAGGSQPQGQPEHTVLYSVQLSPHDATRVLPPGYISAGTSLPEDTTPGWGWAAMILPYLDHSPVFNACNFDLAVHHAANSTVGGGLLNVFVCPTDIKAGYFDATDESGVVLARLLATNSYAANFGAWADSEYPDRSNGLFYRNSSIRIREIVDGTSSTFAVGERPAALTQAPWVGAVPFASVRVTPGAPVYSAEEEDPATHALAHVAAYPLLDVESGPADFFSMHAVGAHFLMADGSVRFIKSTTSLHVLQALATRAGSEPLDGTDY